MHMQFTPYAPHPLLRNYIARIWVFTSGSPIPRDDMKLIVPNGRLKLIIPFKSVKTVKLNGSTHRSGEHCITLVGLSDTPHFVNSDADDPSGTIGVEFHPHGAYRFFRLNYQDIKNQLHPLTDILGTVIKQLEQQLANTATNDDKVQLLQQFLIKSFLRTGEDAIFDFCIEKIQLSKGTISVKELQRRTGYSSRWLNMKFMERVGISPKNLSAIIRFQEVYRALTAASGPHLDARFFYDYYYDQSHFIKDFKRFTGMPPHKLSKIANEFGKLYFKE